MLLISAPYLYKLSVGKRTKSAGDQIFFFPHCICIWGCIYIHTHTHTNLSCVMTTICSFIHVIVSLLFHNLSSWGCSVGAWMSLQGTSADVCSIWCVLAGNIEQGIRDLWLRFWQALGFCGNSWTNVLWTQRWTPGVCVCVCARLKTLAVYREIYRDIPDLVRSSRSRPILEAKQGRAWLVLGWETAWEYQVL